MGMGRPGVFYKQVDLSQVVRGSSVGVAAFAGDAKWGPDEELTLISSTDQFVQLFGKPVSPSVTPMHYQVFGFLQKGSKCCVVRSRDAANTTFASATSTDGAAPVAGGAVTSKPTSATITEDIGFYSKYAGVYDGGSIYIEIADSDDTDGTFTLKVGTSVVSNALVATHADYEQHAVSLVNGAKDGYGRSMFLPDVLERDSFLLSAVVNDNIAFATETPADTASALALTGGTWTAADAADIASSYALYHPLDAVTVDYMVPGSFDASVQLACITAAETRGDAFAILAPPSSVTNTASGIQTWVDTNITNKSPQSAFYGSLVAIRDNYNDRDVVVPCAGFVAGAYAYCDRIAEPWYAPAGPRRGRLDVLRLESKFDGAGQDTLYDANINWVGKSPRYGVIVEGQKTLYGVASALQSINVQRLILVLKRALMSFLQDFLYEFNNDLNRTIIGTSIRGYLDTVKSRQGLIDFKVVCDETNNTAAVIDANELRVDIYIKPPRVAEYLYLRTIITGTGVNFDDLVATGV